MNNRYKPKMMEYEKFFLRHSFLQCNDFSEPLVVKFVCYKGCSFCDPDCPHKTSATVNKAVCHHNIPIKPASVPLRSCIQDCISEINCMKSDMLENNISVYEFARSKKSKVYIDDRILVVLAENTYPIYSDVILNRIKRSALLDKLSEQQVYTIAQRDNIAQRIVLDADSVRIIAKYLDIEELINFAVAFRNPSNDEHCLLDNPVETEAKKPEMDCNVYKKRLRSRTVQSYSKAQKRSRK